MFVFYFFTFSQKLFTTMFIIITLPIRRVRFDNNEIKLAFACQYIQLHHSAFQTQTDRQTDAPCCTGW